MRLTSIPEFETTAPELRIRAVRNANAIGAVDPGYYSCSSPVPEAKTLPLGGRWRGVLSVRESGQVELRSTLGGSVSAVQDRGSIYNLTDRTCNVVTWSQFTGLYAADGTYIPKSKLLPLNERANWYNNSRVLSAPRVWLDSHHNIAFPLEYMPGGSVAVWPTVDSHPYTQTSWGVQQPVEADLKLFHRRARQIIGVAVGMLKLIKLDDTECSHMINRMMHPTDLTPALVKMLFTESDTQFQYLLGQHEVHEVLRFYQKLTRATGQEINNHLRSDGAANVTTRIHKGTSLWRNIEMGIMRITEHKFLHVRNPRG